MAHALPLPANGSDECLVRVPGGAVGSKGLLQGKAQVGLFEGELLFVAVVGVDAIEQDLAVARGELAQGFKMVAETQAVLVRCGVNVVVSGSVGKRQAVRQQFLVGCSGVVVIRVVACQVGVEVGNGVTVGAVVSGVATGDAARAPDDVSGEFVAAELAVVLDEVADVLFEGVFLFFTEGGGCLCEVGEQGDLCDGFTVFDGGIGVAAGVEGGARDGAFVFEGIVVGAAVVDVEGEQGSGGIYRCRVVDGSEAAVKAEDGVGGVECEGVLAAFGRVGFVLAAAVFLDIEEDGIEFFGADVATAPGADAFGQRRVGA